jgi:hypothetical protein
VSAPVNIMTALTAYGAKAVIEQGRVRLVCRHPLPAELIETARAHRDELRALLEARRDCFEKRAANETSQTECDPSPYAPALAALRVERPAYIDATDWQRAIEDGDHFVTRWGEQAEALGWASVDLLGLHTPPEKPAPNYRRLSRYDQTGLIWLLSGRAVTVVTSTEAVIQCHSGASLKFFRRTEAAPATEIAPSYKPAAEPAPTEIAT